MDSVNTKNGQFAAREAATIVNQQSFTAANLVGFQTGASAYTTGSNAQVLQQVRFADKATSEYHLKQAEDKRVKEKFDSADTVVREESIDLASRLESISDVFGARGTELAFSIDNGTAKQVVTVTDKDTGDIIRQIPSEEALRFAARMQEFAVNQDAVGILIDRRA